EIAADRIVQLEMPRPLDGELLAFGETLGNEPLERDALSLVVASDQPVPTYRNDLAVLDVIEQVFPRKIGHSYWLPSAPLQSNDAHGETAQLQSARGRQCRARRCLLRHSAPHFGTLALWHPGTLAPWHPGTLAPWH